MSTSRLIHLQLRWSLIGSLDYESLTQLATGLKDFADTMPGDRPLIAIIERIMPRRLARP